jgi:hypothetical protein
MPIVQMPDGAHVQFPDNMPPDQIRSLILQKFPDAAKSGGTLLPRKAASSTSLRPRAKNTPSTALPALRPNRRLLSCNSISASSHLAAS